MSDMLGTHVLILFIINSYLEIYCKIEKNQIVGLKS